jgi:hypothetical protein
MTKRCSKCGLVKELSDFHRSATSRDGRTSRCKSCRSADTQAYLERRREAELAAEERAVALSRKGVDLEI